MFDEAVLDPKFSKSVKKERVERQLPFRKGLTTDSTGRILKISNSEKELPSILNESLFKFSMKCTT